MDRKILLATKNFRRHDLHSMQEARGGRLEERQLHRPAVDQLSGRRLGAPCEKQ